MPPGQFFWVKRSYRHFTACIKRRTDVRSAASRHGLIRRISDVWTLCNAINTIKDEVII